MMVKMKKILFFATDRQAARNALEILFRKKFDVVGCVFEEKRPNKLSDLCARHQVKTYTYHELLAAMKAGTLPHFDWGISYLYHKIITRELIDFAKGRVINFHPAPVEIHKGVAPCVYCLLSGAKKWATTAHYLTEGVDEGDVIRESYYDVPDGCVSAIDFEHVAQEHSLALFGEIAEMLLRDEEIPRRKQPKVDCYHNRKELEREKEITPDLSSEEIDRRIRAFWFPPYHGANIVISGKRYSLVDDEMLKTLGELYGRLRLQSLLPSTKRMS